jgi:hypothetical protein
VDAAICLECRRWLGAQGGRCPLEPDQHHVVDAASDAGRERLAYAWKKPAPRSWQAWWAALWRPKPPPAALVEEHYEGTAVGAPLVLSPLSGRLCLAYALTFFHAGEPLVVQERTTAFELKRERGEPVHVPAGPMVLRGARSGVTRHMGIDLHKKLARLAPELLLLGADEAAEQLVTRGERVTVFGSAERDPDPRGVGATYRRPGVVLRIAGVPMLELKRAAVAARRCRGRLGLGSRAA